MSNPARERIKMSDSEIVDHFERLGYHIKIDELIFTTESVDDFREARAERWVRPGRVIEDDGGLLVIEGVQARPNQRARDVVVVSLGYGRAVMGSDRSTAPADAALHRYAPTLS
jgi:hypothetical protein